MCYVKQANVGQEEMSDFVVNPVCDYDCSHMNPDKLGETKQE